MFLRLHAAIAIGFLCSTANAESYYDLITPECIVGFENNPFLENCSSLFPEMKEEIDKTLAAWRKRNTASLKEIHVLCQKRLVEMKNDYDISAEERDLLMEGANQFFKTLLDNKKSKTDLLSDCRAQLEDLNSDKWDLRQENVESEFAGLPIDVHFMRIMDSSFRKDAPRRDEANYTRDRELDFAEVAMSHKSLLIGKISAQHPSGCRYISVEKCISLLGRTPDERRVTASGEENLIYYGKKLLYRGTLKNNRTVGPEWRILVAKNGRITDEYEVVQVLELKEWFKEAYDHCEIYGDRDISLCPTVELIK